MKKVGYILAIGLLITTCLSAQTKQKPDSDSIKTALNSYQKALSDTLKLANPFQENRLQTPYRQYAFPKQGPNFAQENGLGKAYGPNYKMPIVRPDFKSNMPVARPDSSVHYFIQIKK